MATINFPTVDLNNSDTLTHSEAGITWTWNEPLGVWSSDLEGGSGGGVPGDGVSVEVGETAPGSPSDGDLWFCTAEAADGGGRLYVYYQDLTSNQWVDVSQPGTCIEYLSKTEDDTAAGQITFEGQTTHEAGVSVTGGDKTEIVNGFVNIPSNNAINIISDSDTVANFKQAEIGIGGTASAGRDVTIRNKYIDTNETGLFVVKGGNGNGTHIGAITTQLNLTNNATATAYGLELTCSNINTGNSSSGDIYGAFVSSNLGAYTGSGKTYGYYSQLNTSARTTYAFFAAGDAPNYFAGEAKFAPDPDNAAGWNGDDTGVSIGARIGNLALGRSGGTKNGNHILVMKRLADGSDGTWDAIRLGNFDRSVDTSIRLSGSTFRSIDTRLGATGVAMADGAADIVKALQPKVISQGTDTFAGFLPADLAGTYAEAMDGTAGATVAVGTYTNPDGVVETDVEEPEAIPFGATWVQTGTQDVMQSVCRENLIPLLTKALQGSDCRK